MNFSRLISATDDKLYTSKKMREEVNFLRFIYGAFILLYGAFGYLDLLLAQEYLKAFLFIRFVIVIPCLLSVVILSYHKNFHQWGQLIILTSLVVGGFGISYMLIMLPDSFSYYGGAFMVLYGGYFLLKLNTGYAIIGGVSNLALFIFGYAFVHGEISFDIWLIFYFLLGSNVIGAIGNYLLEKQGRILYIQEREILEKNQQLESRVYDQNKEILQIWKALQSVTDAIVIYNAEGTITYSNQAYDKLIESYKQFSEHTYNTKENLFDVSIRADSWENEQIIINEDGEAIVMLLQGDVIKDDYGKTMSYVQTYKNITARKDAERKIEYLSFHDGLTGVYNRRFFDEELKRINVSRNLPLSIVLIDVNGLKLVNDAFGHVIGDKLLIRVAHVLKKTCRSDDIFARVGGDEFAILLPQTSENQAHQIIKRIREVVELEIIDELPLSISVSCGCSTKSEEEQDISNVFKTAEDHMYRSKISEKKSHRHQTIGLIMEALYVKSPREQQHSQRVSILCEAMGSSVGVDINELITAGMLHDIGKVVISESILEKITPLSEAEWIEIKKHPEVGFNILSSVPEYGVLADCILSHHEHWNGLGYPMGLIGSAIPLSSRIIAIADAYDAMISDRPYRKGMSHSEAIAEIRRCSGSQFDPDIVKVFIKLMETKENLKMELRCDSNENCSSTW